MPFVPSQEYETSLLKKMTPPLVTLLASEPEIQCVALRNIHLILQKQPSLLSQEMVFSLSCLARLFHQIQRPALCQN